jgi:hypothetical protein
MTEYNGITTTVDEETHSFSVGLSYPITAVTGDYRLCRKNGETVLQRRTVVYLTLETRVDRWEEIPTVEEEDIQ